MNHSKKLARRSRQIDAASEQLVTIAQEAWKDWTLRTRVRAAGRRASRANDVAFEFWMKNLYSPASDRVRAEIAGTWVEKLSMEDRLFYINHVVQNEIGSFRSFFPESYSQLLYWHLDGTRSA